MKIFVEVLNLNSTYLVRLSPVEAEEEAEVEHGEEEDDEAAREAVQGVGPVAAGQEPGERGAKFQNKTLLWMK